MMPPFIIQNLVENAIKHAFKHRRKDNIVCVDVQYKEASLKLSVSDNGHGIAPEKLPSLGQISVASETGTGSALENLNRRLTGLYGSNAKLHFDTSKHGTTVSCKIPYHLIKEER